MSWDNAQLRILPAPFGGNQLFVKLTWAFAPDGRLALAREHEPFIDVPRAEEGGRRVLRPSDPSEITGPATIFVVGPVGASRRVKAKVGGVSEVAHVPAFDSVARLRFQLAAIEFGSTFELSGFDGMFADWRGEVPQLRPRIRYGDGPDGVRPLAIRLLYVDLRAPTASMVLGALLSTRSIARPTFQLEDATGSERRIQLPAPLPPSAADDPVTVTSTRPPLAAPMPFVVALDRAVAPLPYAAVPIRRLRGALKHVAGPLAVSARAPRRFVDEAAARSILQSPPAPPSPAAGTQQPTSSTLFDAAPASDDLLDEPGVHLVMGTVCAMEDDRARLATETGRVLVAELSVLFTRALAELDGPTPVRAIVERAGDPMAESGRWRLIAFELLC